MGYVRNIVKIIEEGIHYIGQGHALEIGPMLYPFFRGMLQSNPMTYSNKLYNLKTRSCAVYALVEVGSGKLYVGSSGNVYKRITHHKETMRRKIHSCRALKELLSSTNLGCYDLIVVFAVDREEAYEFEQGLINHYRDSGRLLNYGLDVRMAMRGRPLTEEHRQKLSQVNMGRVFSDEWRARITESRHSSPLAQRQILTLQESRKRSIVLNGVLYPSVKEAVRQTGFPESGIHKELRKKGRNEDGPYILDYVTAAPYSVSIDGVEYMSVLAASKSLGVSEASIRSRVRRGKANYF